jgi:putative sterol carrier protein
MSVADDLKEIFEQMPKAVIPEKAAGVNGTIQLNLSGEGGGSWYVNIADSQVTTQQGQASAADLTLDMTASDYIALTQGQVDPMNLFMAGKIQVQGDMALAMKFQEMFDAG